LKRRGVMKHTWVGHKFHVRRSWLEIWYVMIEHLLKRSFVWTWNMLNWKQTYPCVLFVKYLAIRRMWEWMNSFTLLELCTKWNEWSTSSSCLFIPLYPSRYLFYRNSVRVRVPVLLAADSQSTSSFGYRASLWDPWPDFILLFFFRLTITLLFFLRRPLWRENGSVVYSAITH
jgi:hypothetical protein